MRKNKFLIPLGSLAVVAPVVAVVSCGTNKQATSEELGVYKDLTSSTALKILENKWQEKVLDISLEQSKDLSKIDFVVEQTKFYIYNKVKSDKRYLWKLGQNILASADKDAWDQTQLTQNGIFKEYSYGSLTFGATEGASVNGLTDKGLAYILNNDKLDVKSEVLKQLVIQKYLKANKDNFKAAFPDSTFSSIDNQIDPTDFVLVREMINQKLFAKWEASLDSFASPAFAGKVANFSEAQAAIKSNGSIFNQLKRSEQKTTYNAMQFSFSSASEFARIGAFNGFSSMSATGNKILSFTEEKMKLVTTVNRWEGFVQENDIIDSTSTEKVKYIPEKTSTVKLTYVKGVMPIWDGSQFKFSGFSKTGDGNIYQLLALKTSLYDDAMKYFTTKRGDTDADKPVILEIINKTYEDILINKLGVKFVKERTAE